MLARISWKFLRIRAAVDDFQHHFDQHYAEWSQIDFRGRQPHELLALYRQMEDALLWNWKTPIINDFYVMVHYGILKKLCVQWCDDRTGSLQNGLLCASGNLESAKPARLLLQLARVAAENDHLRELILREPSESLPQRVADDPRFESFQTLLDRYLAEYGLRCANELKLEELSYRDRPELVYKMVRNYLLLDNGVTLDPRVHERRERNRLQEAERAAFAALEKSSGWWPRTAIFRFVLNGARLGIHNRENLRFARTKIYGIARPCSRPRRTICERWNLGRCRGCILSHHRRNLGLRARDRRFDRSSRLGGHPPRRVPSVPGGRHSTTRQSLRYARPSLLRERLSRRCKTF